MNKARLTATERTGDKDVTEVPHNYFEGNQGVWGTFCIIIIIIIMLAYCFTLRAPPRLRQLMIISNDNRLCVLDTFVCLCWREWLCGCVHECWHDDLPLNVRV